MNMNALLFFIGTIVLSMGLFLVDESNKENFKHNSPAGFFGWILLFIAFEIILSVFA